jgi:hypothetical protein
MHAQIITARLGAQPTDTVSMLAEGALLTKMEQHERACDSFKHAADEFQARAASRQSHGLCRATA